MLLAFLVEFATKRYVPVRRHFSVLHPQHYIGLLGDGQVMGDDDDAAVLFMGQTFQDVDDIRPVFSIQVAGGLIGKDDLGLGRQGLLFN